MALSATDFPPAIQKPRAKKGGMFDKFTRPVRALTTGLVLTAGTIGSPMLTNNLHAAEPRDSINQSDQEVVKLKDGKTLTKDQYFDLVIKNATRDGILKSQDAFKIKDSSGKEIEDTQGYKKYISSIKERAAQFTDPKGFSKFINGIRTLRDQPGSNKAILTPRQVDFLIEYPSISKSDEAVGKLHGGLITGWTIDDLRKKADEYVRNLELETVQLSSNR